MKDIRSNMAYQMRDQMAEVMILIEKAEAKRSVFRDLFYIDTSLDICDKYYTAPTIKWIGEAGIINCNGADDLPPVSFEVLNGDIVSGHIIGSKYKLGYCDVRAYELNPSMNFDMNRSLIAASMLMHEQAHNNIALNGIPALGLYGLLSHPNIAQAAAPNGISGFSTWTSKTADEIMFDVTNVLLNTLFNNSKGSRPNKILMSSDNYNLIATMPVNNFSTATVLEVLINRLTALGVANAQTALMPMFELNGTGYLIGITSDQSSIQYRMTMEAEPQPAEYHTTYWDIGVLSGSAGLYIPRPEDHLIVNGV